MDAAKTFAELDTDNDGLVTTEELMVGMLEKGCEMEDIAAFFRALDINSDCRLTKEEFEAGIGTYASLIGGPPTPEPEKPIIYDINKWGRKVFAQFDANRDGKLSTKELVRGLKALPKTRPKSMPAHAKFMSVEDMIAAMDEDKDGFLSLHEWLYQIKDCPGLEAAISEAVDESGELASYRSLEQQLKKREAQVAAMEQQGSLSEKDEAQLSEYMKQIAGLKKRIQEAQINEGAQLSETARVVHELISKLEERFSSLREAFLKADEDRSGMVSIDEIRDLCVQYNLEDKSEQVIGYFDLDENQALDYEEFTKVLTFENFEHHHGEHAKKVVELLAKKPDTRTPEEEAQL